MVIAQPVWELATSQRVKVSNSFLHYCGHCDPPDGVAIATDFRTLPRYAPITCAGCGQHFAGQDICMAARTRIRQSLVDEWKLGVKDDVKRRFYYQHMNVPLATATELVSHYGSSKLPYDVKPFPEFLGQGSYFIGAEIEVESGGVENYELADEIMTEHDSVYCMGDGSLTDDYGLEIATQPMSWDYLRENGASFFGELFDTLRRHDCESSDAESCGIHFHLCKSAFKDLAHKLRFASLFCSENFNNLVRRAAKRRVSVDSDFARTFTRTDLARCMNGMRWQDLESGGDTHRTRYMAVNFNPSHTVEVRVFNSTTNPRRMMEKISFTVAALEYTRESPSVKSMTPKGLATFLEGRADEFADARSVLLL